MTVSFLYPIGYANLLKEKDAGLAFLEATKKNEKLWIVDIRKSPYGPKRFPHWHGSELKKKYRYIHFVELGNKNYHNRGLPIELVDEQKGMERLYKAFQKGYSIILLCGCKDFHTCHRRYVLHSFLKYVREKK